MNLSLTNIIIMSIGTLVAIVFIVFLLIGKKYDEYLKPLNSKDFPLYEIYGFGLAILDLINYKYRSKREIDRRKEVQLLYEERYVDYYLSILAAQRITLSTLVAIGSFALYGLSNDINVFLVMQMFVFVTYYYFANSTADKIKKRSDELLSDFPEMVSKLALLINAGMIMKEAWKDVAYNGEGTLYEEMRKTVVDMENNVAEVDAYLQFSNRCVITEIKKFTSLVIQGLVKGNKEFSLMINEHSKEIWVERQENVRQQGEKASSKLLIPICIMFVGILIMIIVPIFANLGV